MQKILNYLTEIILGIVSLLVLGLYGLWYYESFVTKEQTVPAVNLEIENQEMGSSQKQAVKYVEIKGAVEKPGVYSITEDTIINDVVNMAGGFKKGAYTNNINLSMKLEDQTVIYIYTSSEYSKFQKKEETESVVIQKCECPTYDITDCTNVGSSVVEKEESNSSLGETNQENIEDTHNNSSKVNINTANVEQLISLNGIGDVKAKAIIEYRETNGNFSSIEDIKKVSGISESLYEKIKDSITI